MKIVESSTRNSELELGLLQKYANLLDSSIRIPGTNRTFGIDPILGLIPIVGDLISYLFSALLLMKVIQLGASKRLMLKMMGNIALDASIGIIPVVGTIFDFTYKANERNLRLFKEYHIDGKHRESTMKLFLGLAFIFLLLLTLLCFGLYKLASWMF